MMILSSEDEKLAVLKCPYCVDPLEGPRADGWINSDGLKPPRKSWP
jgi:hypothetical protein